MRGASYEIEGFGAFLRIFMIVVAVSAVAIPNKKSNTYEVRLSKDVVEVIAGSKRFKEVELLMLIGESWSVYRRGLRRSATYLLGSRTNECGIGYHDWRLRGEYSVVALSLPPESIEALTCLQDEVRVLFREKIQEIKDSAESIVVDCNNTSVYFPNNWAVYSYEFIKRCQLANEEARIAELLLARVSKLFTLEYVSEVEKFSAVDRSVAILMLSCVLSLMVQLLLVVVCGARENEI